MRDRAGYMSLAKVIKYLSRMVAVADFLMEKGILYLQWTSELLALNNLLS